MLSGSLCCPEPPNPTPHIHTHNEFSPTSVRTPADMMYLLTFRPNLHPEGSMPDPDQDPQTTYKPPKWARIALNAFVSTTSVPHKDSQMCTFTTIHRRSQKTDVFRGNIKLSLVIFTLPFHIRSESVCSAALSAFACFTSRLTGLLHNTAKGMHGRRTTACCKWHTFSILYLSKRDKTCCPKMLFIIYKW